MINQKNINLGHGMETILKDGDIVVILPHIGGGGKITMNRRIIFCSGYSG